MGEMKTNKTVAVVTTTIGRDELEKSIVSIQQQTYPCQHYVFVDGKQYWDKVQHLQEKYPDVIFTFLPMNTGGKNNIGNGAIHAILPYLLEEDVFCFLDDDNWHDPEHVEYLVKMIDKYDLDYAYSLRRNYDRNYNYLCDDNITSIGFWTISVSVPFANENVKGEMGNNERRIIDTNSYAITRKIAFNLCQEWYSGVANDQSVFEKLLRLKAKGGFTAKRTTHYKLTPIYDEKRFKEQEIYDIVKAQNKKATEAGHTWQTPALCIEGSIKYLSDQDIFE
ncbi:glycosyltransferase family 2 protein [Ursidibacter sp. B-7004-1]